jgi:hypothetical protein
MRKKRPDGKGNLSGSRPIRQFVDPVKLRRKRVRKSSCLKRGRPWAKQDEEAEAILRARQRISARFRAGEIV